MKWTSVFGSWVGAARRRSAAGGIDGDRRGIAAVEFALFAPFLMTTMVGLTDLGFGLYRAMQVDDAARAGLQYALVRGFDASGISAQVAAVSQSIAITAAPAPQRYCGCAGGSGVTTASCDSFCPDGSTAGTYVAVTASATYVPPIAFPLFPDSFPLSSTAIVRLQ